MKSRLLAGALCLFFLTGCSRDASELTVVTGIGVDGLPGDYQIDAEVLQLSEAEKSNKSVLLQMDGATLSDGINRMVTLTGRTLYCNHTQVLVIGRKAAEEGLRPLLNELICETQYPVSLRVAIAKDSAAQILRTKPVISDIHSVELENILKESAAENLSSDPDISTFYEEITLPGKEAVLPLLELHENNEEEVCRLMGSALFLDDKLLTVLEQEESRCLMWMRGQAGGTLKAGQQLLEVTDLKSKITARPDGAVLQLELGVQSGVGENQREELIETAEASLRQQCEMLLQTLQHLGCDAVGFGYRLYQTSPECRAMVTQEWRERFVAYPIHVEVTVKNITWGRVWTEGKVGECRGF